MTEALLAGRRAFVTGASGFIGSHLACRLVALGADVLALVQGDKPANRRPLPAGVTTIPADLQDCHMLTEIARSVRPELVFHLAAATTHGGVPPPVAEAIATNLVGTVNLIDALTSVDVRCAVLAGSAFEYGAGARPRRESERCRPTTAEGITKLGATEYALDAARRGALPVCVLRLFSIYGPDDDPRRLVPRLIAGALSGDPVELSDPVVARDFLFVNDVLDLFLTVAVRPEVAIGRVLNAGSGVATPLGDLAAAVQAITGSSARLRWGAYPFATNDFEIGSADLAETVSACGWRPRTGLTEGLERCVAWVRRGAGEAGRTV